MSGHIRRRGAHSWELKFDAGVDAKTGKRLTKYCSFKGSKQDAKVKLAELITAHAKGTYVDASKITVAEHVAARIAQWQAAGVISGRTAERYNELLANQIAPHIGSRLVQKLKVADIEAWHGTLRVAGRKDGKGGVSSLTVKHAHSLLAKSLKDGTRHDLVSRNVAADQGTPKVKTDEVTILAPDQVRGLLTRLVGHRMHAPIITAFFCGVRRGELLALRWRHIDFDSKTLHVVEALDETKAGGIKIKPPKTKAGIRDIALPDIVIDALRDHRKGQLETRMALGLGKMPDDAFVFPAAEGTGSAPRSPRIFSAEWCNLAASIGLDDISLHALRHTHASMLIAAGVDVVLISKRLGHSNPSITLRVYAHQFAKRDDRAADAINAAFAGFGKP
jgi:integrase